MFDQFTRNLTESEKDSFNRWWNHYEWEWIQTSKAQSRYYYRSKGCESLSSKTKVLELWKIMTSRCLQIISIRR